MELVANVCRKLKFLRRSMKKGATLRATANVGHHMKLAYLEQPCRVIDITKTGAVYFITAGEWITVYHSTENLKTIK